MVTLVILWRSYREREQEDFNTHTPTHIHTHTHTHTRTHTHTHTHTHTPTRQKYQPVGNGVHNSGITAPSDWFLYRFLDDEKGFSGPEGEACQRSSFMKIYEI